MTKAGSASYDGKRNDGHPKFQMPTCLSTNPNNQGLASRPTRLIALAWFSFACSFLPHKIRLNKPSQRTGSKRARLSRLHLPEGRDCKKFAVKYSYRNFLNKYSKNLLTLIRDKVCVSGFFIVIASKDISHYATHCINKEVYWGSMSCMFQIKHIFHDIKHPLN